MSDLGQIVRWCDRTLRTAEVQDYDGAVNGLQFENQGRIERIAAAVDASLATVKMAIRSRASLLVVHHGLFWGKPAPWTGRRHELIRLLVENNLAVYSSHLPLDVHSRLGNNALLSRALGLKATRPFFFTKGRHLGVQSSTRIDRDVLVRHLEKATGAPARMLGCGPQICRRVGVVTGGAGAELSLAAKEGVDTFITGEGPHWTFPLAGELGINVLYGGHYATETFGVKALAAAISRRFGLPWQFVDCPSGL